MDARAEAALEPIIQRVVASYLDQLLVDAGPTASISVRHDLNRLAADVELLRRSVLVLERTTGTPNAAARARRAQVLALRADGHSAQRIAQQLGVTRQTVNKDLRVLGAPTPGLVVGRDGRTYSTARCTTRHGRVVS